jgi:hypothetical protein
MAAQYPSAGSAYTYGYGGSVPDVALQPAQAATVKVEPDLKLLRVGGDASYSIIRAQLVDASGNPTVNNSGRAIAVTLEIPPETGGAVTLGTFHIGNLPEGAPVLKQSVEIPVGQAASTPAHFFAGTKTGSKTVTWSTLDGTKGSFAISTTTASTTAALKVQAETAVTVPWTNNDSGTDGSTVTVTVQDKSGVQMSNATGAITVECLNEDARVIAFWDPDLGWVSTDYATNNGKGDYLNPAQVPVYRGQAKFRVQANTSGMKTYTISYDTPPDGGPALSTQAYSLLVSQ